MYQVPVEIVAPIPERAFWVAPLSDATLATSWLDELIPIQNPSVVAEPPKPCNLDNMVLEKLINPTASALNQTENALLVVVDNCKSDVLPRLIRVLLPPLKSKAPPAVAV